MENSWQQQLEADQIVLIDRATGTDATHASRAMQAALETKLPVWLGVGCKKTKDGKIVSFD